MSPLNFTDLIERLQEVLQGGGANNEITQPTITGDFDGDGTTETINVGWDQIETLLLAA